jgi:hypothetical protein
MMSDWERRQLAAIEQQLGTDDNLVRVLAGNEHRRRWIAVRRFIYPRGYLALAMTYPYLQLSSAWRVMFVQASLVCVIVVAIVEVAAAGKGSVVRRGGRHFRQLLSG